MSWYPCGTLRWCENGGQAGVGRRILFSSGTGSACLCSPVGAGLICGDEPAGDGGLRAQAHEGAGEVVSRACQAVALEGGESVDDEDGVRSCRRHSGSGALPPVPLAAGDASVVTPDHLAWLGVLDSRLTMRHGVEVLVAGGSDQPGRALVLVQVLAANWHQVRDRGCVVCVGEAVD